MIRIIRKIQLALCHALLSVMVLALFLQIISRGLNFGVEWTEEISRFTFISFVFISASYATIMKADLRIGVFADWLCNRVGEAPVQLFVTVVLVLFDCLMAIYCFGNVLDGRKYPSVSPVLGFNTNYLFLVLVFAFSLSAVARIPGWKNRTATVEDTA
ncbi:hypothetical protein HCU01_08780 [Halomonas cupida]|uniref:TRAP transporter small permease protein n=1 Tax=Halomonas cupida TaxID=44933 RepID=A0A1M7DYV6_9GAMM|nr:TRAP transporter small permease subunit [Halomonas cupida]GEN22929.1 hypothetical protein HCU01_08780 [Halomonas cupida]SHL84359.1 TRAP-type C4-dicarboxylate transport system, small permease component [Halomonas cupida]